MERDPIQGPYGLYDKEKVKEIGVERAIRDTIRHIEQSLEKLKQDPKERAKAEISRLKELLKA
jgi:hypothetical protein